jgi:hypothetical protein
MEVLSEGQMARPQVAGGGTATSYGFFFIPLYLQSVLAHSENCV